MDPMRTLLLDALRAMPDSAETRCMIAAMEGSGEGVGCECPVEPQVGIWGASGYPEQDARHRAAQEPLWADQGGED